MDTSVILCYTVATWVVTRFLVVIRKTVIRMFGLLFMDDLLQDRDLRLLQETHRHDLRLCRQRRSRTDAERLELEHMEKVV